ncbi:MAG: hypothetical protein ACLUDU_06045 [Butyricimonas faecihominis]
MDRQIKLMVQERIQFSRDLMAVHYQYRKMAMVGYEKLVTDLYNHTLSMRSLKRK